MGIETSKTDRGFKIGKFIDRYDNDCSIQESSIATEVAIWLGVDDACPQIPVAEAAQYGIETTQKYGWVRYPIPPAVSLSTRMHLTQAMAADLIPLLQHFVDHGTLPEAQ